MHFSPRARWFALAAGLALTGPALAQDVRLPALEAVSGRVMIKRGEAYLPITDDLVLQATDSLVVLEGGSVNLTCGDFVIAAFEMGIHPVPPCPTQMAAAPVETAPAAAPAESAAVPASTGAAAAATGGSSNALLWTGAIAGTAAVVAVAASGGGGDNEKPVSP